MCMYVHSLAPEADDLGGIRVISTAGGIPYVNSKQVKLFVVKVKVERPKKTSFFLEKCLEVEVQVDHGQMVRM